MPMLSNFEVIFFELIPYIVHDSEEQCVFIHSVTFLTITNIETNQPLIGKHNDHSMLLCTKALK